MSYEHPLAVAAEAKFYVYAHFRADDGRCFYVGKGKAKRAWSTNRSAWWKRTVAKHGYNVQILATWDSEEDAFEHERVLIACFRDLGHPLVNLTDGGEGASGAVRSEETLAKMSEKARQQWADPEARAALAERQRQRWSDPDARAALAEHARQRMSTPEARQALSERSRQQWADPRARAAQAERARRQWADPDARARMSGESSPVAKLSDEAYRQIFRLRAQGLSQAKIAVQIGCDQTQVSRILLGKLRRNIFLEFHPEQA